MAVQLTPPVSLQIPSGFAELLERSCAAVLCWATAYVDRVQNTHEDAKPSCLI